jgi:Bacteriophage lambda head decoration protein D
MPPFPQVNPIYEFRHDLGFVISEARGMRSRDAALIGQAGYRIVAGTVMGKVTAASGEIYAESGNTGNPTFSSVTVGTGAQDGTYRIVVTALSGTLGATDTAAVYDPYGNQLANLTFGSAYSGQFGVTITAGTVACAVGDTFFVNLSTATSNVGTIWASSNNTGNPTFSAIVPETTVKQGVYQITCTDATHATVTDPEGNLVGTLTFGSGFSTQIGLTITAGTTACVAGDTFYVKISPELYSGTWLPYNPSASDGTQTAAGILAFMVDVTYDGFYGTIMARDCEVNSSELMWGPGVTTLAQQQTALASLLTNNNIIARPGIGGLVTGVNPPVPFPGTLG